MMTADHVELQQRLLQCAGDVPPCERVSAWVVQAIRPAARGKRTDAVLFGLCDVHKPRWRELVADLEYHEGFVIEWEGIGPVFEEMERAGWL